MTDRISSSSNNLNIVDTDKVDTKTSSASTLSHTSAPARSSPELDELKKRQEFVANKSNFKHQFSADKEKNKNEKTSKPISPYKYESNYKGSNNSIYGEFKNKFKPKKWTFIENIRFDDERNFFASDIAQYQYTQVSEKHGFQGKLPDIIKRECVANDDTLEGIKGLESGTQELQDKFLTSTPNGKTSQRIMNDFGLTATKVELRNPEYESINEKGEGELKGVDILIHVKPKDS
ncbi:Insecticidal toxin protein [Mycoavidus cysteinexigens]|uniref:Insecticidal toxin protein n=1 Tax=Mycoavidus cysteinexigens TaxID=1553431 RepID=A0A2Z6EWH3_9BURK|nr:hypothetical protein [Mycoavidus cysteinexigens]BBE09766.1 Insecticidal toxin protein [Mycoavidus cysteinexigens]GAM53895.1 hypothetical protein EBME_2358 [bacterium endosymbiont of Mortierella elongata FMR23-6]GLR01093.1 hypothetical protein GCM10007934_09050 [Mycoavidus cysteinexigens]